MCNMLNFLCLALFGARLAASEPGGAQVPIALTSHNSTRGKLTVQCTTDSCTTTSCACPHVWEGDYYERSEVQSDGASTFWLNDVVDYSIDGRVLMKCRACEGEMYTLSDGFYFHYNVGAGRQVDVSGLPSYSSSLPWLSFRGGGFGTNWDSRQSTIARVTSFTSAAGVTTTRPGELQMASSGALTAEAKAAEEMDEAAVAAAARDGGHSHGQRATAIMAFAATAAAAFAVRAAGRRAAAGSATGASAPLLSA